MMGAAVGPLLQAGATRTEERSTLCIRLGRGTRHGIRIRETPAGLSMRRGRGTRL